MVPITITVISVLLLLLQMDEAAIVARIRREHSVGTQVYFEDPEFPANDKSLYHVCYFLLLRQVRVSATS
jgi:hypothetical protein